MKIRRHYRLLLASLSTALFAAAVVLWLRSNSIRDRLLWERSLDAAIRNGPLWVEVRLIDGRAYIATSSSDAFDPKYIETSRRWYATYGFEAFHYEAGLRARPISYARTSNEGRSYSWLGFEYHRWQHSSGPYGSKRTITAVPFWLPTAMLGVTTGLTLRMWWKHRRRQKLGLCARCGYDLRATPGRCPECGDRGDE